MNKLDKQFEEMMKGIRIDSPSSDFAVKVMSRIQAEAAVQRRTILAGYQPVISRRTWIILLAAFLLFLIYITVSSQNTAPVNEPGIWSALTGKLPTVNTKEVSNIWKTGLGLFTSIPPIAYLILTASLALWMIDSFLVLFRHRPSEIQVR
jgi:hypothetical protein